MKVNYSINFIFLAVLTCSNLGIATKNMNVLPSDTDFQIPASSRHRHRGQPTTKDLPRISSIAASNLSPFDTEFQHDTHIETFNNNVE